MTTQYWIDTRDKPGLLYAMMKEFKNKGCISFEGTLSNLNFNNIPGASVDEREPLTRSTTSPELDFMILPLTDETVPLIWKELVEKDHLVHEGIIHVQIEKDGELQFGGYDNFHKECVVAYQGVSLELLAKLKNNGVIREYE